MKILKPILLVSLALSVTNLLEAQEMTAKTSAKTESTIPPAGSKPALAPDMKPETKTASKLMNADPVPATASPLTRDQNQMTPEKEKPTFKTIDGKRITNPLSAENKKTLEGTAKKPQNLAVVPASKNDEQVKPLQLTKPAVLKTQQDN